MCACCIIRVAFPLSPVSPNGPTVPNGCVGLRTSW
ncbi:unnamed protein product [Acanthoscelides obtectus]|uniref:Uncharacterized protein n=1 Tax=Acanthoscelides obtectus TaxID=200917 RepID=A0A9P0P8W0_ACAOB|nr:unnamed protein product [Acanthoscelides obtectus]CAK1685809.1 hypothetical protein AOBTE_LOCUS35632 [Acanthoscelides obtectus]